MTDGWPTGPAKRSSTGRAETAIPRGLGGLFPGPSVQRVMDTLGRSLLDLCGGAGGSQREVVDVHILGPDEPCEIGHGALVLAVGISADDTIAEIVTTLADRGAAGLMVRTGRPLPSAVAAADAAALPLLRLGPEASWSRVAEMIAGTLTGSRYPPSGPGTAGLLWGDLFSLANAISAVLNAPVTIEDPFSRVLAFSDRQDEADQGRVQTILGRRVPEPYLRMLSERGVFRALRSTRTPVFVEPLDAETLPRVAIGVFAGNEPLGSIWAVTSALTTEGARALAECARIAALHLLRMRVTADAGQRLQADLVAAILEGGARAEAAAARLLPTTNAARVLAIAPVQPFGVTGEDSAIGGEAGAGDVAGERALQHLRDAVAVQLAGGPRAVAASLGGVVYVVLPADGEPGDQVVAGMARTLAAGVRHQWDVAIGIGPRMARFRDLARSRDEADHVLRVLLADAARSSRRVAELSDVQLPSMLLALADLGDRGERIGEAPITALIDYDAANAADLLHTIEVFLDCWGSANRAAAQLHIHENTLRYRIQRACEIAQLDLTDPDQRLAVTLALRLRRFRGNDRGTR